MARIIKQFFVLLFTVAALGAVYVFLSDYFTLVNVFSNFPKVATYEKCDFPISWRVGDIDNRFGVAKDEFRKAILRAEKIWEDELSSNIFEFSEDGKMSVSLIYDDRQEATDYIKSLIGTMKSDEEKYGVVKSQYESLIALYEARVAEYQQEKAAYELEVIGFQSVTDAFEKRQQEYNKEIEYWNKKGGAPDNEYARLVQEGKDFDAQYVQLKQDEQELRRMEASNERLRQELNFLVDRINSLAKTVNSFAEKLNAQAGRVNTIEDYRGDFETGRYISDSGGQRIEIYQFFEDDDLVRILAHEIGHAISIGHADAPEAIMYFRVADQPLQLADADVRLFQGLCGE